MPKAATHLDTSGGELAGLAREGTEGRIGTPEKLSGELVRQRQICRIGMGRSSSKVGR